MSESQHELFVGIDVAKARLDVGVHPSGESWAVEHDEAGIATLVERLVAARPTLVILEATGGLELAAVAALVAAAVPVQVVNPRQARDFAKATGQLAKTDRLDALVLAHFGAALRPEPRPIPDAALQEVRALVARRRQLQAMVIAEKNRRSSARSGCTPRSTSIWPGSAGPSPTSIATWPRRSRLRRPGRRRSAAGGASPASARS